MKGTIRNKSGFTVVELCIVIAVTGIIVALVVAFMTKYQASVYGLKDKDDHMQEISSAQTFISNWMSGYDSTAYTFSIDSEHQISVTKDGVKTTLVYNDGDLNGTKFKTFSDLTFGYAQNKDGEGTEYDNEKLIVCKIYGDDGKSSELIFSRQSTSSRNRYYSSKKERDKVTIRDDVASWLDYYSDDLSKLHLDGDGLKITGGLFSGAYLTFVPTEDGSSWLKWSKGSSSISWRTYKYALTSVVSMKFSLDSGKIYCNATFDDGTKEKFEWNR